MLVPTVLKTVLTLPPRKMRADAPRSPSSGGSSTDLSPQVQCAGFGVVTHL